MNANEQRQQQPRLTPLQERERLDPRTEAAKREAAEWGQQYCWLGGVVVKDELHERMMGRG